MNPQETNLKKKSFIRWNAIIPFVLFCVVMSIYFKFFFDGQLRRGLEFVGYKALGAEVNIAELKTSFFDANIQIKGIEFTDEEKPSQDSIKIGDIRFGMLWDALLRVKFVINEVAIEKIEFAVPRTKPGKVAPPEPVSTDPSLLAIEGSKLKNEAQHEIANQGQGNALGEVIAMLNGKDLNTSLHDMQDSLPSKALIESFNKDLAEKQKSWESRLQSLPKENEIKNLSERLSKIKYKDFKTPQELMDSLQQFQVVLQDADKNVKQIQTLSEDFNKDYSALQKQYGEIEKQLKIDTKNLEQKFKIPQIDAKSLAMAAFSNYLLPYKTKFFKYKSLAETYLPPKFTRKDSVKNDSDAIEIQPHPREKGITYEYGRTNSYPLFWMKKAVVSSQAGSSNHAGNIKGEVLNITSNQNLIGQPTTVNLSGDFPSQEIHGVVIKVSLDNRHEDSLIDYLFTVGSYQLAEKALLQTPEVTLSLKNATGEMSLLGSLKGLKELNLNFENQFSKAQYNIESSNQVAQEVLKSVFASMPVINLKVLGQGVLPNLPLDITSNLGAELQKGFQAQIQNKISEAQKQVQAYVDQEVGKQKAQIDEQLVKIKSQYEGELKKSQLQLEEQKKNIENKTSSAKKDAESQGKKKLETEGKKVIDDLKKQFGF